MFLSDKSLTKLFIDSLESNKTDQQPKSHNGNSSPKASQEKKISAKSNGFNMAFSDSVYSMIQNESERLGVSAAYYVNFMLRQTDPTHIREYYNKQPIKANKNCIPRKKGKPAKRIFIKFDPDVYALIKFTAAIYNQTLTQYVNLVLESNM